MAYTPPPEATPGVAPPGWGVWAVADGLEGHRIISGAVRLDGNGAAFYVDIRPIGGGSTTTVQMAQSDSPHGMVLPFCCQIPGGYEYRLTRSEPQAGSVEIECFNVAEG